MYCSRNIQRDLWRITHKDNKNKHEKADIFFRIYSICIDQDRRAKN